MAQGLVDHLPGRREARLSRPRRIRRPAPAATSAAALRADGAIDLAERAGLAGDHAEGLRRDVGASQAEGPMVLRPLVSARPRADHPQGEVRVEIGEDLGRIGAVEAVPPDEVDAQPARHARHG
jgi:hypothetical protein